MELEIENTEVVSSNEIQVEVPASIEVTEGEKDYEVSVVKKEYTIIGDSIFIPSMYEDAPPWLKEFIDTTINVAVFNRDQSLIDRLQSLLSLLDYVPKNQYTEQINQIVSEDGIINSRIATLNSSFSDAINSTNATIAEINLTYASKNEAAAIAANMLSASLSSSGLIGSTLIQMQEAFADLESTTAQSVSALESVMEGEINGNAQAMETIRTYVGIDEAGASTHTGLSAYLEASDGTIGGADSQLANSIRVTAEGVESKWAYNSVVNVNGVYRKSGFGLTTNNFSGNGTQANPYNSEFWIDATKLRFTNSNMTGGTAPFTIDASGATPQVKFNGIVEFTNVSNISGLTDSISKAQSTADTANSNALARTLPREVAHAVNTNTTTINGSKITTGTVTANQIAANTITANKIATKGITADRIGPTTGNTTVWQGGGLVSQDFNGTSHGDIGNPTRGFRLSSNATGTYANPNVYGAYIRGGTVDGAVIKGGLLTGTSLLVNNMVVQSEDSSIHYGKIMHYESKDNAVTIYQNTWHNIEGSSHLPRFITRAEYDALPPSDAKNRYEATKGTILSGGSFGPGSSTSVTVGLKANRVTSASSNIQCTFSVTMSSGNTDGTAVNLYVNNNKVFTVSEYNWSGSNYTGHFTAEFRGNVLAAHKENIVIVEIVYEGGGGSGNGNYFSYRYLAPSAIIYNM